MKGNALLKQIFNSNDKLAKLVRWSGRGWDLVYKWVNPDSAGEPNCLQRTLDLIDLAYLFDPTGARQIAELPLHHYNEIVRAQAAAVPPCNEFENAFRGLKEATEAGEALTDRAGSLDDKERQLTDVIVWAEENLERVRAAKGEKARRWEGGQR